MADLSFDGAKITVPCPKCRHEERDTIGSFRRQPHRRCGACGVEFDIDTKPFDKEVGSINQALKKMFKG